MTHLEVTKLAYEYRRDYESGMTMKQIAESRGVSFHTVYYRLRSVGCNMRAKGHPAHNHWRLLSLVKAGATLTAVGNAMGVTKERVRQIVRKHGLSQRMNKTS